MVDDPFKGKCRFCYYNNNFSVCPPMKVICNMGNCSRWRMYKLSDDDRAKEKAVHKEAYLRDREKRKLNRKQRRKDARGGA